MRTVRLGRSELQVSEVGFGGIPIVPLPVDEAVASCPPVATPDTPPGLSASSLSVSERVVRSLIHIGDFMDYVSDIHFILRLILEESIVASQARSGCLLLYDPKIVTSPGFRDALPRPLAMLVPELDVRKLLSRLGLRR